VDLGRREAGCPAREAGSWAGQIFLTHDGDLMAMIAKPFEFGSVTGVKYEFERAGDVLPVHVHDADNNHISIIAGGSFRCIGAPAIDGQVLPLRAVADWPAGQEHGFVALEDNSCMVQIRKVG
jgi:hypothetical protein